MLLTTSLISWRRIRYKKGRNEGDAKKTRKLERLKEK
jgi:hypothetical protein